MTTRYPVECLKCGVKSKTQTIKEDEDHAGWLCDACYKKCLEGDLNDYAI
jgi:hypothetical protein